MSRLPRDEGGGDSPLLWPRGPATRQSLTYTLFGSRTGTTTLSERVQEKEGRKGDVEGAVTVGEAPYGRWCRAGVPWR